MESMSFILMVGVEVRAVDLRGNDRLRPQSPLARDDGVVSKACWVGYCSVAVSDSRRRVLAVLSVGGNNAGGSEKSLEFLSRFPVGDNL